MLRALLLLVLHPFCLCVRATEDRINMHSWEIYLVFAQLCSVIYIAGLLSSSKLCCPDCTVFEARIYNGLIYCN